MIDLHTLHSVRAHLSPALAAQVSGVSRWTIMRAIKDQQLLAKRDNRNHWKIDPNELDRWRSSTVRTVEVAHPLHTPEDSPKTLAKLAGETARADAAERARDQAEADRDAWREMAQKRHRWWPW
jgi:hypothetical protein